MIVTSTAQTALNLSTKDNPVIGWQSFVTATTITATSSLAGYPVSNLTNPATRPPWQGGFFGNPEIITVQLSGVTVDYLAIAAHNLFSTSCIPSVETCTNFAAGNWVAQTFPAFALTDNGPLIFRFVPGAYQGVRLRLSAVGGRVSIGVLNVGQLLVFERSLRIDVDHTPVTFAKKSKVISGMSESGNFLGRIVQSQWTEGQIDFQYMTPTWFRTTFAPFYFQSAEVPFFMAWWPTRYPGDVAYLWLTEDMTTPDDTITDRFTISMKYRGLAT